MGIPEDVHCVVAEPEGTASPADVHDASAVAKALLRELDLMLAELEGMYFKIVLAEAELR